MALGSKLKMMLSERGITVKDFAAKIQIPPTTLYSFIQRDSSTGKLELIAKICKGLEIDMADFFKDDDGIMDLTSLNVDEINTVLRSHSKISNSIQSEYAELSRINDKSFVINTDIDTSHPFYLLQEKINSGEQLTNEEASSLISYAQEGIKSISISLNRMGEKFEETYRLLNNEGQNKAIEYIEMLTKIPEYQRKEENED